MLCDKQKRARSSSITITLAWQHISTITSLEENRTFFYQGRPLLEPDTHHREVFSTTTPDKPSNFGQAIKGPDQNNWIKVAYEQYYKNIAFGLPIPLFPHANLSSTTCVLQAVLSPVIKNISDNIYQYCLHHCNNGGTQLKGVGFYQSSSPILAALILRLIVAIATTHHITIGIVDVTNDFQNSLKDSYEREIIDCPPHYLSWFKFHFPNIHIQHSPDDHYAMDILHGMRGTKPSGLQCNTILNLFLYSLGFINHAIKNARYTLRTNSEKYILEVGSSTDEFLCE